MPARPSPKHLLAGAIFAVGLLAGLGTATPVAQAANASPVPVLAGNALLVPVWWYGRNGGICRHAPDGSVYCQPSYGRSPNPAYYRSGHTWVPGHWFRGRWIPGHWTQP